MCSSITNGTCCHMSRTRVRGLCCDCVRVLCFWRSIFLCTPLCVCFVFVLLFYCFFVLFNNNNNNNNNNVCVCVCVVCVCVYIYIYIYISRSSQCSTTGVTKAVVCAILSVGWCI